MQWSGTEKEPEISLAVQWLRLCTSTARGMGAARFAEREKKRSQNSYERGNKNTQESLISKFKNKWLKYF